MNSRPIVNHSMLTIDYCQKVIGESTVIDIDTLRVQAREEAAVIGPAESGKSELPVPLGY